MRVTSRPVAARDLVDRLGEREQARPHEVGASRRARPQARGRAADGTSRAGGSPAADLLLEPGRRSARSAAQVGYGSPYALSAAFKRLRGVSPREHRTAALLEAARAAA